MSNNQHHTGNTLEVPVVFECQGQQLIGIVHQTDGAATIGVVIVVGGPQYRVGSHRQFVLLARHLSTQGIPVLRFDVRGMGNSEGQPRDFKRLDDDIRAAIDQFVIACPSLSEVVLWGLCDGASAALFYAYQDPRVKGLVLLNPWVFTEQGAAKTYLKHYYLQRLFNKDLWLKVLSLKFNYANSLIALWHLFRQATIKTASLEGNNKMGKVDDQLALPIRMRECWKRFPHPVLLILSGRDLTADEFRETVNSDLEWRSLCARPNLTRHNFDEADHTFSSAVWRDQVAEWTLRWLKNL